VRKKTPRLFYAHESISGEKSKLSVLWEQQIKAKFKEKILSEKGINHNLVTSMVKKKFFLNKKIATKRKLCYFRGGN